MARQTDELFGRNRVRAYHTQRIENGDNSFIRKKIPWPFA